MQVETSGVVHRFRPVQAFLHHCAVYAFAAVTVIAIATCVAAAFDLMPWLDLGSVPDIATLRAGMVVQIAGTALLTLLLAYLPGNARLVALEQTHRRFAMNMEDVTRAYYIAHQVDRAGVFKMESEFDAVKERMRFLRRHPELKDLEPELIEIASQMSRVSAELADVYSDEKVARAYDFLVQRQQECDRLTRRLDSAEEVVGELRDWIGDVETNEAESRERLARMRKELTALLPELLPRKPKTPPPAAATQGDNVRVISGGRQPAGD